MGFLCQAPSHRVAFYPNDRLGNKWQRRGLWGGKRWQPQNLGRLTPPIFPVFPRFGGCFSPLG